MIINIILSLIFIWNQIYGVLHKIRLDVSFKERDVESTTKLDLLYYLIRFFYWIWIVYGFFFISDIAFSILIGLSLLKLSLFFVNRKAYIIYDNVLPFFNIVIIILFIFGLL